MIFCTMSSPPTKSAPASCASRTFSPLAITRMRTDLPRPLGRTTVPRTTWSECLGSTPRLMANSTVSLNLVWCVFFKSSAASASLYGRASTFLRAFSTCFPAFLAIPSAPLPRPRGAGDGCDLVAPELLGFHDFQAHVARRTHHGAHRGLQIGGVEIDKLDLRNFLDLLFRHLADFVAVRFRGTLRDIRRALEQHRSRRGLQNKRERAVGVNRHEHRKNHPVRFLRGLGVELLAEIHDVQAMWAERSADRRRRSGFARGQLQLDGGLNLLCHVPASISFCFRALLGLPQLLDACKIQLDRSRASKNRHRNLQTAVIVVDFFDVAVEIRKRAIHDAHLLVALENHFRFRAVLRRMHAVDNAVHFGFGQWRR